MRVENNSCAAAFENLVLFLDCLYSRRHCICGEVACPREGLD